MTKATEIKPGEIIALSLGEYSSYHIKTFARVLKPINATIWEQLKTTCKSDYTEGYVDEEKILPWLLVNGFIEEIPYTELNTSIYGMLTPWDEA